MNPVLELQKLLKPKNPNTAVGEVVSVVDGTVTLRMPSGMYQTTQPKDLRIQKGDSLLVKDGIIQGKVQPLANVPVYDL